MSRDHSAFRYVRAADPVEPERRDYTCGWRELQLGDTGVRVGAAIHIASVGANEALCGRALGPEVQPEPVPKLGVQACRECRRALRKLKRGRARG
jgi:hypothetical protein